jgi:hypothetical protein
MDKRVGKSLIYSAIFIFIVILLLPYLFPTVEGFQDLSRWLWSDYLKNWIYVPAGNTTNINSVDVYSSFLFLPAAKGFVPSNLTNINWDTLKNKPGDSLTKSSTNPPGGGSWEYSNTLGSWLWLPSSYPRPLQDNAALIKEFAYSTYYYDYFVPYDFIHSFQNPNTDMNSKARPDKVYDDGTWTWIDSLGKEGGYAWIRAKSPANTKSEIGKSLSYSFWPFLQAWLPDAEFGKVPTSPASIGIARKATTDNEIDDSEESPGPRMSSSEITTTAGTRSRRDLPDGSICILPIRK